MEAEVHTLLMRLFIFTFVFSIRCSNSESQLESRVYHSAIESVFGNTREMKMIFAHLNSEYDF